MRPDQRNRLPGDFDENFDFDAGRFLPGNDRQIDVERNGNVRLNGLFKQRFFVAAFVIGGLNVAVRCDLHRTQFADHIGQALRVGEMPTIAAQKFGQVGRPPTVIAVEIPDVEFRCTFRTSENNVGDRVVRVLKQSQRPGVAVYLQHGIFRVEMFVVRCGVSCGQISERRLDVTVERVFFRGDDRGGVAVTNDQFGNARRGGDVDVLFVELHDLNVCLNRDRLCSIVRSVLQKFGRIVGGGVGDRVVVNIRQSFADEQISFVAGLRARRQQIAVDVEHADSTQFFIGQLIRRSDDFAPFR